MLAGAMAVLGAVALPSVLSVVLTGAFIMLIARGRWRPAGFAASCGALLALTAAQAALERRWPTTEWNAERVVVVDIVDFVRATDDRLQFRCRWRDRRTYVRELRLAWYRSDVRPRIGERWQLTVRLRPPRGLANPGGFDVARYALAVGLDATGYVVPAPTNRRLTAARPGSLALWRRWLADTIATSVAQPAAAGVLIALATGSRHALDGEVRALAGATGTAHLFAISGLHVGLAAAIGMFVGRLLGTAGLLGRRRPARAVIAVCGIGFASGYALLAGFALPTRRALVMLVIALALWVSGRGVGPARALAMALVAVLVHWPLSLLSSSFYLSFGAVGLLMLAAARDRVRRCKATRWRFLRYQGLIGSASLVVGLLLFDLVPWSGFIANLLMIPLIGIVVVPLLFVAAVAGPFQSALLALLGNVVHVALAALRWLAAESDAAAPELPLLCLALAAIVVWLPVSLRSRSPLLIALLLLGRDANPPTPATGCFWADIIDVGQGQAVLVSTRSTATLIDTGPAWPGGSAATGTILPFAARQGVVALDRLIVSHGDNDHAGGASEILQELPVQSTLVGETLVGDQAASVIAYCRRGQNWVADDVQFRILGPPVANSGGNNGSCVLQVSAGQTSLLIPGDIESRAERELVARYGAHLASSIVVMPHHGSASSSSTGFVAAVAPTVAIASAGYRNRWGFPAVDVVRRWQRGGARVLSTGQRGHIRIVGCQRSFTVSAGERRARRRWWHTAN